MAVQMWLIIPLALYLLCIDGRTKSYDYDFTVTGKNYIGRQFFDSSADTNTNHVNIRLDIGINSIVLDVFGPRFDEAKHVINGKYNCPTCCGLGRHNFNFWVRYLQL